MAKAIAIVAGGYNAKEEIKGHGGTWAASAKLWVMTPAQFEKMKARTQSWGMSAYRAIQATEGKVVDFTSGVVGEWIEPVAIPAPAPAPAPAPEVVPAPEVAPAPEVVAVAEEITVYLKSAEKRCVNYTLARIKGGSATAEKIKEDERKNPFKSNSSIEYNQRTGSYSYYFGETCSAKQVGDTLTIKFKNPSQIEVEIAKYIKSNPSCVNGFNPK